MQAERDRSRQLRQMQEGSSAQAKRDIARLEQIKRDREEAARRREMEKRGRLISGISSQFISLVVI